MFYLSILFNLQSTSNGKDDNDQDELQDTDTHITVAIMAFKVLEPTNNSMYYSQYKIKHFCQSFIYGYLTGNTEQTTSKQGCEVTDNLHALH